MIPVFQFWMNKFFKILTRTATVFVIKKVATIRSHIIKYTSMINERMRNDQFNHDDKLSQQIILYRPVFKYT